jgi:hypothetical protein
MACLTVAERGQMTNLPGDDHATAQRSSTPRSTRPAYGKSYGAMIAFSPARYRPQDASPSG